jgi:hypothetical protein
VSFGPILAPNEKFISLSGESLVWRLRPPKTHGDFEFRSINPKPEVFEQFLRLCDATNDRILRFAQAHGVLGLCFHGLPLYHPRTSDLQITGKVPDRIPCHFDSPADGEFEEPLDSWRVLAASASALLRLKLGERSSRAQQQKDWAEAAWLCTEQDRHLRQQYFRWMTQTPVSRGRVGLDRILAIGNEWLRCAGTSLRLWRDGQRITFRILFDVWDSPNLFGYLANRLTLSLAEQRGFLICTDCGIPFAPKVNRVSPKRRHFCEKCRAAGRPGLYAKRDYRERQRLKRNSSGGRRK